ncbi:hypothetical protein [Legionella fallonii]|uniref:Uncharacterized protein n=1 Tax=Legionella fallonii LLAP-10 TaxID=1212491 RepID=A0A098G9T6_9GAMM|nr:hypothetical protein [Legionella fallonii]CEG58765.1 protein of unknown function [Legionella fallonii LLAP-10]
MSNQLQMFVRGTDGNLWLETGPFGDVQRTIATRTQIDANVSNLYSQAGVNRIWRTPFQAINPGEVYVLGSDDNLWLEHAPFGAVPPSRIHVDANVSTFQAVDLGTILVLGTDGNLWLETAPFGNVPPHRQQIDGNVQAFQALDMNTIFVLGTDGNLWLETAPFGKQIPPLRQQVDGNVIQFWAMDSGTVYVLGSDLNFWYEPGPFGNLDITTSIRTQIASNVNDFQPLRLSTDGGEGGGVNGGLADVVFFLKHDGSLWLAQGPYEGPDKTSQTSHLICNNAVAFDAQDPSSLVVIDGNQNLWLMGAPFDAQNTLQVDGNVNSCFPLFPKMNLIGGAISFRGTHS